MTEAQYQTDIRALGAFVDEAIEDLLNAVNPSVAKRLARQAVREAMWRAMGRAAQVHQVVLERQRRVQERHHGENV